VQANSAVEKILPQLQRVGSVFDLLLGENGEIAVLAFDHRIQTILPLTADLDKLSPALKKIKPGSSSSVVNDAVMSAINILRIQDEKRRRVIIVVAQNKNGGSEIHTREVMTAADFAQVTIYPIDISKVISDLTATPQYNRPNAIPPEAMPITAGVIGTPTTVSQNDMGNWIPAITEIFDLAKNVFVPNPLSVYARYTGGHSYSFMTQKDLEHAISAISQTLHSEYMLTYRPTNIADPGFHQIVVKVKHRDLKITTRDGYYWAGEKK
jgi:VWFA-related protein